MTPQKSGSRPETDDRSLKRKIDWSRLLNEEVSSDDEDKSVHQRHELCMPPTECFLPRASSLWKVNRRGQIINIAILPPVGVPFFSFKFKIMDDTTTLFVTFEWPKEFTDGEQLCNYWIKSPDSNITEYHPKISGYDSYFETMKDKEYHSVIGTMHIPLLIHVNPGSLKAFEVPLSSGVASFIEVEVEEAPKSYSGEVSVTKLPVQSGNSALAGTSGTSGLGGSQGVPASSAVTD